MGYMRSHAIVVTAWSDEYIAEAHAEALKAFSGPAPNNPLVRPFESLVGPLVPTMVNGGASFCVHPDGSKEWWGTSDHGDACRDALIAALNAMVDDGHWVVWVEVQFADDERETKVTRHSDERASEDDDDA